MAAFKILKDAVKAWVNDNGSIHCAALAYYTVFSIAPLLIISIAIAGFVYGEQASRGEIFGAIQGLLGTSGAKAVESMVYSASRDTHTGVIATISGMVALLLGASGVFQQLQQSLNLIWKVQGKSGRGLWIFLRQRLISFSMVLVIGFLLLVSLVSTAALAALGRYLGSRLPGGQTFWHLANFVISFGVVTVLFAAIFKILPDVRISWADVWIGAATTAFLFDIGKLLIGLYLGQSSVASSYGVAGSLIIVLIWVFYSSAILLLGAEFTRVYASRGGRRVLPKAGSEYALRPENKAA